jgi:uncharacterized protein (TIGR00725 family)
MSRPRQVAVIGPGEASDAESATGHEVGKLLGEAGAVLVCGGLGGVMEAAAHGAHISGGDVVGILPGADPSEANPYCTHVVATTTGSARNLAVVASADAVIAIGGSWGTLSEIAHARQLGRRVIALLSWKIEPTRAPTDGLGVELAHDPADAVRRALE